MRMLRQSVAAVGAAALAFGPAGPAAAADYPSRPITLVAPQEPGGASDLHARVVAHRAQAYAGQKLVLINKAGAAGVVGSDTVVRASRDGYTLLSARVGAQVRAPAIDPSTPYTWSDFTFLGLTERTPFVLAVNARKSPYKSFKDLERALKGGKKLSYASLGDGTLPHIAAVLMADAMGANPSALKHVRHKSDQMATGAVVYGQVDFLWQRLPDLIGVIRSRRVRALAVTDGERLDVLKDTPTVGELGYREMETIIGWSGLFGPPGLPGPVVDEWVRVLARLRTDETFNRLIRQLGGIPDIRGPDETRAFVKAQYDTFRDVAAKLDITPAKRN